jgi:hypothetical protein
MKELPIIMGTESVQAILKERKTVTRRVVTGNALKMLTICTPEVVARDLSPWQVGDRLWVREGFAIVEYDRGTPGGNSMDPSVVYREKDPYNSEVSKWKSPMFMPRFASRINLEVVSRRIERLQDITSVDAIAEGIPAPYVARDNYEPIAIYLELWNKLNAKRGYPWELNPWVWVISFKKV